MSTLSLISRARQEGATPASWRAVRTSSTRSPDAYARCHIPGAINLATRTISPETTASLPRDKVIVTYCWGPGCNGSTRAAAKLAALGFRVKEMIGGIGYWRKEGLPVEGSSPDDAPLYA